MTLWLTTSHYKCAVDILLLAPNVPANLARWLSLVGHMARQVLSAGAITALKQGLYSAARGQVPRESSPGNPGLGCTPGSHMWSVYPGKDTSLGPKSPDSFLKNYSICSVWSLLGWTRQPSDLPRKLPQYKAQWLYCAVMMHHTTYKYYAVENRCLYCRVAMLAPPPPSRRP